MYTSKLAEARQTSKGGTTEEKHGVESQNWDTQQQKPEDGRTRILEASIQHVPQHGWTLETLAEGESYLKVGMISAKHGHILKLSNHVFPSS